MSVVVAVVLVVLVVVVVAVVLVVVVVAVVAVVVVLVKILQVTGAVQEVAEMLISEDPGLLVVVVISGTVQVEVDSQPVSSATEVALVEA